MAEGRRPHEYFSDPWNNFDFTIVVISLTSSAIGGGAGNQITGLRLLRLLRVLKLVRVLPKLRILVMGLLKSLSSIAYIGLLLLIIFYLYAVIGVNSFRDNDPVHFRTPDIAFVTLFRCATLEDWSDVMYINMQGCDNYGYFDNMDECTQPTAQPLVSVFYFCSFVVISALTILNLFIGVILASMDDAKAELEEEMKAERERRRRREMASRLKTQRGGSGSSGANSQFTGYGGSAQAFGASMVSAYGTGIPGMPRSPVAGPSDSTKILDPERSKRAARRASVFGPPSLASSPPGGLDGTLVAVVGVPALQHAGGSLVGTPVVGPGMDKDDVEEEEELDRMEEMLALVDELHDQVTHLKNVHLDRWVRSEEGRIRRNFFRLQAMGRAVGAIATLRKGSMLSRGSRGVWTVGEEDDEEEEE
eukprot:CAMPEP_0196796350 /NCGR_PEP_ID=MMETSP1104-20130614/37403_1 /TAXON_ID=33652 /ORGANISM="Cafeteria sp., Strain Caron Lab Isolate" /LENGTH=418 /DNA_ID=CAMNT_0042166741 /DNA_START=22 /DNA_END=1275 /DNA_ORIENTATION=-